MWACPSGRNQGGPIADLKLERGRRGRDRLLQRLFRFCVPARLAEGGGESAVGQGMTPSAPCAAAKFGQSASAPWTPTIP